MEFEKLIEERYSVRQFKPEHLSNECITKILNASHKAPTGCNFQPQRILVLNTDYTIEKLKKQSINYPRSVEYHFFTITSYLLRACE